MADLAIRKETVVRKLTELREAHELTQERAAGQVGVTVRQWQRWESGASVPYARNLSAIAQHFGISENEFFDSDPEPQRENGTASLSQLDRIERKLDLLIRVFGVAEDSEERFLTVAAQATSAVREASQAHARAAAKREPKRSPRA